MTEPAPPRELPISVSDQVFQYLKERIARGEWKPGEKIPSESRLCQMLGVSRSSVRSAIGGMTSLGLLESRRGDGTYVCQPDLFHPLGEVYSVWSQADRISMLEFRKVIEVASAGFAAARATTEMVDAMHAAIDQMESATTPREIVQSDLAFHRLLAEATNNSAIVKSFGVLYEAYICVFEENVAVMGSTGVEYHRRILSAIETRNAELAKRYMSEHLDNTATILFQQRTARQNKEEEKHLEKR